MVDRFMATHSAPAAPAQPADAKPAAPVTPAPALPLAASDHPALQKLMTVAGIIAAVTPNKFDDIAAAAINRMLVEHAAGLAKPDPK